MRPHIASLHARVSLLRGVYASALYVIAVQFDLPAAAMAQSARVLPATETEVYHDGDSKADAKAWWDRWSDAEAALRLRGSHHLGRFVHRRSRTEKDSDIRAALERAQEGLTKR